MAATNQKLQLLADALALEFSQSLASEQCAAALKRLLPGLDYLSIAVTNPAQAGSIVASANCAAEGPTTLHLHDSLRSVVGLAVTCGQPVQSSLLGNESSAAASWTDVQQMVAAVPSVTHLLCLPFGCTGGNAAAGDAGSNRSEDVLVCQQHAASGSGTGALLFGLSQAPSLDSRRAALLGALAACLPAPMAALSGNTLAFVNLACGNTSQCTCCCGLSSEEEEEETGPPASPCNEDHNPGSNGGGSGGTSQVLPVASAEEEIVPIAASSSACAGASGVHWWEDQFGNKASAKAAAASASKLPAPATHLPPERSSRMQLGQHFGKALLAAVGDSEAVVAQNALTLSFRTPLVEREYSQWVTRHHLKVDVLFCLLLTLTFAVVSFAELYRLVDLAPVSPLLCCGMLLPLLFSWANREAYICWRDQLVVAMRLYVVAVIAHVSLRSYQPHLSQAQLRQWITFWTLTGAEGLCIMALGFPIRLRVHLPLQFAAMGIIVWSLPHMCLKCFPDNSAVACLKSSAAIAAGLGYLLPTGCLRFLEQRRRAAFASQLRSAASLES